MSRLGSAMVVLVAFAPLLGCSQSASLTPAASPEPSFTCTPEAGGPGYVCDQTAYEEMLAKDALYAEAEAVYRKFHAEDSRISRAGGADKPSQLILETTSGEFQDDIVKDHQYLKAEGLKARGETPKVLISRNPGTAKGGSEVSMIVCIDSSQWAYFRGSEELAAGGFAINELYFARTESGLTIIGADGRETESCV